MTLPDNNYSKTKIELQKAFRLFYFGDLMAGQFALVRVGGAQQPEAVMPPAERVAGNLQPARFATGPGVAVTRKEYEHMHITDKFLSTMTVVDPRAITETLSSKFGRIFRRTSSAFANYFPDPLKAFELKDPLRDPLGTGFENEFPVLWPSGGFGYPSEMIRGARALERVISHTPHFERESGAPKPIYFRPHFDINEIPSGGTRAGFEPEPRTADFATGRGRLGAYVYAEIMSRSSQAPDRLSRASAPAAARVEFTSPPSWAVAASHTNLGRPNPTYTKFTDAIAAATTAEEKIAALREYETSVNGANQFGNIPLRFVPELFGTRPDLFKTWMLKPENAVLDASGLLDRLITLMGQEATWMIPQVAAGNQDAIKRYLETGERT